MCMCMYVWASQVIQWYTLPAKQETQEAWVRSLGQEVSPGERNGNLLQYSCLENPMDRGAWWVTVHRATKESDMT